jgi:hypothetical protein
MDAVGSDQDIAADAFATRQRHRHAIGAVLDLDNAGALTDRVRIELLHGVCQRRVQVAAMEPSDRENHIRPIQRNCR